jgi:predicted nucleic acid-binding protein
LDACVLIDFATSDVSVLTLVSAHVGQVHVPSPVFDEVEQIDDTLASSLGLKLIEPTLEMLVEAGAARGRLSFQDRICVLVAKAGGFTCVSNDRSLRATCTAEGVPVLWGLELLVELVSARALPAESAREVATQIMTANKRMDAALFDRFLEHIGLAR